MFGGSMEFKVLRRSELYRNERGMTLVEIMIAVSILSVISLSVLMLTKNMNKSVKDAEKRGDVDSLAREISQMLSDKDVCRATFVGTILPTTAGSTNETILLPALMRFNSAGQRVSHPRLRVRPVDNTRNQTIINGMMLRRTSNMAGLPSEFELVVTFLKNPKAAAAADGSISAANTMRNYVTKAFPVRLDDCSRILVSVASSTGTPVPVACPAGGTPVSDEVFQFYSPAGPGGNSVFNMRACRTCAIKSRVTGCL
jgi:prepilin-type N-terminal cleavage/methylation domain-containing protein